jgi:signal transduction histidine kinase
MTKQIEELRPFIGRNQPCWISVNHDVIERKQAEEARQGEYRTLKHPLQSGDHERQTIAYEIHDGLAQYLAGAIMQFDVYKSKRGKWPVEAESRTSGGWRNSPWN